MCMCTCELSLGGVTTPSCHGSILTYVPEVVVYVPIAGFPYLVLHLFVHLVRLQFVLPDNRVFTRFRFA